MEYISIGSSCSVAFQKQIRNIKKESYPFDWICTENISFITSALNDNFSQFNDVIRLRESDNFVVFSGDDFPDKKMENKSIIMRNSYGMTFHHDYTINTNIDEVNDKYKRRISRFIELLKSDRHICFVRDEIVPKRINNINVSEFIAAIRKINNNICFEMIIVLWKPNNNHELIVNNINNDLVRIVINNNEFSDWKRMNVDWNKVFI